MLLSLVEDGNGLYHDFSNIILAIAKSFLCTWNDLRRAYEGEVSLVPKVIKWLKGLEMDGWKGTKVPIIHTVFKMEITW